MKSESGESPKLLQAGPESVAIYDFLYVDRARISALYAQLFPQGILTSVKTTAQQSFSDDSNIGTDVKLFKAETRSIEGGTEGIERMFDASWSVPLDVLAELKGRSLVHDSVRGAGLGSIVMANCMLRVIDFKSMNNLWGPALRIAFANGQIPSQPVIPEVVPTLIEALQAVPQAVHAHFITREEYLWSSLQPENLIISTTDLTLKYGGTVSGEWQLLYVLDAWSDAGQAPDFAGWSAGQVIDSILTAMHGLRTMMGRPAGWMGITPLLIFRSISGWIPKPIPATTPTPS